MERNNTQFVAARKLRSAINHIDGIMVPFSSNHYPSLTEALYCTRNNTFLSSISEKECLYSSWCIYLLLLLLLATSQASHGICCPPCNISNAFSRLSGSVCNSLGCLSSGIGHPVGGLSNNVSCTVGRLACNVSDSINGFGGGSSNGSEKTSLAVFFVPASEGVVK